MRGLISHAAKRRIEEAMTRLPIPKPDARSRVAVLCYHSVHPDLSFRSVTPEEFEMHLDWLSEHCRVIGLEDVEAAAGDRTPGPPRVAITFDDGYADNHAAFEALARRRMPATFFITTGLIERDPAVVAHLRSVWGSAPGEITPLTWSQIAEMDASGMSIGAHTYGHPNLALLTAEEARREIATSRDTLAERLGVEIERFAYPFGKPDQHFDRTTEECAEQAGIHQAVSIHYRGVRRTDDPLRIPRFPITNDSVASLAAKVTGALDAIGWWQEHAPGWARRAVSVDVSEPKS